MADVCHGTGGVHGGTLLLQKRSADKEHDKAWTVHIRCTYLYPDIRRNNESGVGDNLAAGCEQEHDHSVICDGIPIDVVHGTATVIFLWLLARPFLEKLDRVRIKYGVL